MTNQAPDIALAQAALEILVTQLSPAIIPVAHVASITSGVITCQESSLPGWLPDGGGILTFWDGTGEQPLAYSAIAGNQITLDFGGQSYSALQHSHSAGATIATNVLDSLPLDESKMRQSGYPVITCFPIKGKESTEAMGSYRTSPTLQLVYQLKAKQQPGTPMNKELWLRSQVQRACNDVWTITTLYAGSGQNRCFPSELTGGPTARDLQDVLHSLKAWMTTDSTYHYEYCLNLQIAGVGFSVR